MLLPIYLQSLMGYTAYLSGFVLGPGGIATLICLPIAGRLVTKANPKALLAFGIIVNAYATYLMSNFTLTADFNTVIWPRVVLGIGMGFFFIPLTTLTMSSIRKEEMGNATSIFNLMRNLGGAIGIALVQTMLARSRQAHTNYLGAHVTAYSPSAQQFLGGLKSAFMAKGADAVTATQRAYGAAFGLVQQQAAMMAFIDVFYLMGIVFLVTMPLILIMRKPAHHEAAEAAELVAAME